jgi:hypothetical protein
LVPWPSPMFTEFLRFYFACCMAFYKVVPERFRRRLGAFVACWWASIDPPRLSWPRKQTDDTRHALFLGLFIFINPTR